MKDLLGVKLIAFVIIQVEIKDKFFAPADFILLFIWVYPFEFFLLPYLTSNSATSAENWIFYFVFMLTIPIFHLLHT